MITTYMRDKIQIFANQHKRRVVKIHKSYITLQGKMNTIRIYYNGTVHIGDNGSKGKFRFDENKIENLL